MFIVQDPDKILARKIFKDKINIFFIHKCFLQPDNKIYGCFVIPDLWNHNLFLLFSFLLLLFSSFLAQNLNLLQLFKSRWGSPQFEKNFLLILHMLYSFCLVYCLLWDDFESIKLLFMDDKIDWTVFTVTNLDQRVRIDEFFWLL